MKKIQNFLLPFSFVAATCLIFLGGLKGAETLELVELVTYLSTTMAGFGLIAFQIAHVSNSVREDFIESSVLMLLAAVFGFFYLVYPEISFLNINFGEVSIFIFFWSLILFLSVLVSKRFRSNK